MSDEDEGPRVEFTVLRGADELLEVDNAEVFVAYIQVEHRKENRSPAEEMVLNPLPLLRERLGKEVPRLANKRVKWTVTVNRVNAEEPIHNPGPHHLLVAGLIVDNRPQVHCTVYRSTRDPTKQAG